MTITPSTKIVALLEQYPELKEFLISMAQPFEKLRNPLLRRSVAKVASLRQAAAVAGMRVEDLVNALREKVGQEPIRAEQIGDSPSYFGEQPVWFDERLITASFDERKSDESHRMPVVVVLEKASQLQETEILELVTTFVPAPGIDLMKEKGFQVWCVKRGPDLIKSYFAKTIRR